MSQYRIFTECAIALMCFLSCLHRGTQSDESPMKFHAGFVSEVAVEDAELCGKIFNKNADFEFYVNSSF